jgi:MFS family permease
MNNWQFDNYRQVFGYKSFRFFWFGFTLSVLGDMMTRVALTWLVWELTGSARALGWLTFAYTAPVLVGGLLAGWLLDRFGQRRVIFVDSVLRGTIVIIIPLFSALNLLALWHIYVVAAIYGSLFMIPLAGGPALVPTLVDKRHLSTANALETLTFTLSNVIGAPLAGFLITRITAPNVLVLDAVSYFAFALLLLGVKPLIKKMPPKHIAEQTYHLRDAIRLLLKNKILRSTTLMFASANFGLGATFVWLPIYSDKGLGGGAELYGLLLGFLAVGEVLSSILAGSLVLSVSLGTMICVTQFLAGVSLSLLLLGRTSSWAVVSLMLFGFFSAPLTIWAQTLRMQIIPESLRGRTFALLRPLLQSANPIGGIAAGFLLPAVGILAMIGLSATSVGAPGVLGYTVKDLRSGDDRGILINEPI